MHQPNLDIASEGRNGMVRFRTNADGLIPGDAIRAKPPDTTRIMVFGDSMLVGRWLPQDQIYTARLAELRRERGIAADVARSSALPAPELQTERPDLRRGLGAGG